MQANVSYPYNTDDVKVWSGRRGELAFWSYDNRGCIEKYKWISAEKPVDLKDWR